MAICGRGWFFSLYLLNFFLNINTNPKRVHKMTTSEVFSFFSVAQVLHVTVTDLYTVYLTKLHKENAALNGGGVAHHLSQPHKKLTLTPYILSGEKHWAFGGLIDIQKALLCISSTLQFYQHCVYVVWMKRRKTRILELKFKLMYNWTGESRRFSRRLVPLVS